MNVTRRRFTIGALAASSLPLRAAAQADGAAKLTFVLTNDVYKMSEEGGRGGLARLAAVVKAERARNPGTIFAHAGDTLSPSLMSGFDQGEHMVALFNAAGLDILTPGNHEFDFGHEIYRKRMGEAKFAVLSANMRDGDGSRLAGHHDTMLIERDGVKIGLVGATLEATPQASNPGPIKFAPVMDTVVSHAQTLRAAGADFIVAIVHTDKATGQRLMATRAVDLVLSGHNHDLHVDYDGRSALVESSQDALYVVATDIAVRVSMQEGQRTVSWRPTFRIIDSADVAPDPEVGAKVAAYEAELSRELDVEVATLAAPLESIGALVRSGETAIGNLVADAMRFQNNAEVAITNGGGIRGNKRYPVGHRLTRRDILVEMPFGNKTGVTRVTGKGIIDAIENGLSVLDQPVGRFPQVSGLTIVANRSAPRGSRVVSILVNGAPISPTRSYTVATNDFMLRGGDGYGGLRDPNATEDSGDRLVANDVMAYARKLGVIDAKIEGRITLK